MVSKTLSGSLKMRANIRCTLTSSGLVTEAGLEETTPVSPTLGKSACRQRAAPEANNLGAEAILT
jgi:hypothetical protein